MTDSFTLSVPDMSCGHCRASIEAALKPKDVTGLSFDMENRHVTIVGSIAPQTAIAVLDGIGFPATPVAG